MCVQASQGMMPPSLGLDLARLCALGLGTRLIAAILPSLACPPSLALATWNSCAGCALLCPGEARVVAQQLSGAEAREGFTPSLAHKFSRVSAAAAASPHAPFSWERNTEFRSQHPSFSTLQQVSVSLGSSSRMSSVCYLASLASSAALYPLSFPLHHLNGTTFSG